ncbi:hypothetical protein SYNPS1DRAFT_5633, partial [Syncephalis pseudoplumigaleata]
IRRVAIVGAGVSGLMAARYIQQECGAQLDTLRVFERCDRLGGVWIYSEKIASRPDLPSRPMSLEEARRDPPVESPIYASLHTNLPHRLMALTHRPYPSSLPDYPPYPDVLRYWEEFAHEHALHAHIAFNTSVKLVERMVDRQAWRVVLEAVGATDTSATPSTWEEEFDAVVVCNGHHQVAYTPPIPGLAAYCQRWPERVLHSCEYRRPEHHRDMDVMVVGNGPSAVDIARDLRGHVRRLSRSIRSTPLTDELRRIIGVPLVPEIAKPVEQQAWLVLRDGRVVPAPDQLIFATGYRYAFPFLPWLYEHDENRGWPPVLARDGLSCRNLYRQIYYTAAPTLAFLGVPTKVSIMALMERQVWHLASVLSGQCGLPP